MSLNCGGSQRMILLYVSLSDGLRLSYFAKPARSAKRMADEWFPAVYEAANCRSATIGECDRLES